MRRIEYGNNCDFGPSLERLSAWASVWLTSAWLWRHAANWMYSFLRTGGYGTAVDWFESSGRSKGFCSPSRAMIMMTAHHCPPTSGVISNSTEYAPPPSGKMLQSAGCIHSCFLNDNNASILFLDPETGPQALPTLLLFLGLLFSDFQLSEFQSTKAFSFQNWPSLNFAYRLKTIFSTIAPWRIFKLSHN